MNGEQAGGDVGVPELGGSRLQLSQQERAKVRTRCGPSRMTNPSCRKSMGTTSRTQMVTEIRAERLSLRSPGSADRPGIRVRSVGPMRRNRSGTPIRSARMKYPSSRRDGSSCWTISRWISTTALASDA